MCACVARCSLRLLIVEQHNYLITNSLRVTTWRGYKFAVRSRKMARQLPLNYYNVWSICDSVKK